MTLDSGEVEPVDLSPDGEGDGLELRFAEGAIVRDCIQKTALAAAEPGRTKETVLLNDAKVLKLTPELVREFREQLIDLYFNAWNPEGLCDTKEEAASLIDSLDLSETFMVEDNGGAYGEILTLPVNAIDIAELLVRFSSYEEAQGKSIEDKTRPASKDLDPNFRICFSIVSRMPPDKTFKCPSLKPDGKPSSLFKFLIANLPDEPGTRKIADSRMKGMKDVGGDPVEYYQKNRASKKGVGPVSMHEGNGAITVGMVLGSRLKDKDSGGANVWVLYPKDQAEAALFAEYKDQSRMSVARRIPLGADGREVVIFEIAEKLNLL